VKYNSDGTAQWARNIGGTSHDYVSNMELDASANVYLIGFHRSPTITIYNADGTPFSILTNVGDTTQSGTSMDTYIVKYDSDGTPLWARKIGGNGNDTPTQIKLDSSANLYISGSYSSNPVTIYNADETAFTTLTNSGSNDIFIVKYNSEGIPQWARRAGGGNTESSNGIILDNSNNIYMYGYYDSGYYGSNPFKVYNSDGSSFAELTTTGFSDSDSDVFILKYNSDGIPQWLRRIGGARVDRPLHMIFDSSYNMYMFGTTTSSSLDIFNSDGSSFAQITNPGSGSFQYTFIVKYNSSGTPQWITKIGIISNNTPINIVSDSSGNIYVSGNYSSNPLTICNIDGTTFTTLTNSGASDIFIVKYNSDGIPQWARSIGGSAGDFSTNAVVDASENIYISGTYSSNPLIIYNADGTSFTTLTNSGSSDIFIVKYNSDGTPQWARNCKNGRIMKMILDASANIITYGYYLTTPLIIYNADGSSFTTLTNSGNNDIFIIKYDSSGTPESARKISGNLNDYPSDILVDSSSNMYISGTYTSNPLTIINSS
jgi:copper(I)-binding protein